jgi:hypothetical protein
MCAWHEVAHVRRYQLLLFLREMVHRILEINGHMWMDGTIRYPTVHVDLFGASEPGGGVRTGEVASTSYELGKEREPLIKKLDPHMQLERIKGAVPLN